MNDMRPRLFASVNVAESHYELCEAYSVVEAIELIGHAPENSLLIEDGQIGGIVRAEHDGRGWVLA